MNIQKCKNKNCKKYFKFNSGHSNCALKKGVYCYCSTECSLLAYWTKDLLIALRKYDK